MTALAKQLILYKRWVDKADGIIDNTSQPKIDEFVTNDEFRDIFLAE